MAKNQRRYAADEPRPTTGRPPRLSGDDMLLIARLHARGRSLRTIARIVSVASGQPVSAPTIGRWLRRAQEPQEDVQMALASLRAQAVEGWGQAILRGARDGRHAPAKDLLVAAGTIERDAPTERLVILVGDGKTAVGTLPQPDGPIVEAEPREQLPGSPYRQQPYGNSASANIVNSHARR